MRQLGIRNPYAVSYFCRFYRMTRGWMVHTTGSGICIEWGDTGDQYRAYILYYAIRHHKTSTVKISKKHEKQNVNVKAQKTYEDKNIQKIYTYVKGLFYKRICLVAAYVFFTFIGCNKSTFIKPFN